MCISDLPNLFASKAFGIPTRLNFWVWAHFLLRKKPGYPLQFLPLRGKNSAPIPCARKSLRDLRWEFHFVKLQARARLTRFSLTPYDTASAGKQTHISNIVKIPGQDFKIRHPETVRAINGNPFPGETAVWKTGSTVNLLPPSPGQNVNR
jgi:hypothetical protein